MFPLLDAHCPACGGKTLYRGFRGVITCSNDDCPNETAVHQLLADSSVAVHQVIVQPDSAWLLRHPIIERLGKNGYQCKLGAMVAEQRELNIDVKPGRYRLDTSPQGHIWRLTRLKG